MSPPTQSINTRRLRGPKSSAPTATWHGRDFPLGEQLAGRKTGVARVSRRPSTAEVAFGAERDRGPIRGPSDPVYLYER